MICFTRLPPLFSCNIEKIGEPGDEAIALVLRVVVVCTQPQILDVGASTRLLDCSLLFPLFVSMDTTKLGLMLQAMNFTRFLQVSMGNRHLLLTNQITVFVTVMI